MSDPETIAVYDAEVARYAAMTATDAENRALEAFIAALPPAAHVLDLGCGPGHASARLIRAGMIVAAIDASAAMVAHARDTFGVPARQAGFEDVTDIAVHDGVWASFSLLHAPRADFPGHLSRLHRALKPGGVLFLGMKTGAGTERDRLGRSYTYYSVAELNGHVQDAGFRPETCREGAGRGLDGEVHAWCLLTARKPA